MSELTFIIAFLSLAVSNGVAFYLGARLSKSESVFEKKEFAELTEEEPDALEADIKYEFTE